MWSGAQSTLLRDEINSRIIQTRPGWRDYQGEPALPDDVELGDLPQPRGGIHLEEWPKLEVKYREGYRDKAKLGTYARPGPSLWC